MDVISVTNMKGGTGKSTMAAHLAAGFALRGRKVCILDTDPQGHAATLLGLPKEDGLFNMIVEKASLSELVRAVPPDVYTTAGSPPLGKLFIIPSAHKTHTIPFLEQDPFLLGERLEELDDLFDFDIVVIDTAPTASMFDGAVYLAAHGFVYITECETLSFDGIREGLNQIKRFSKKRLQQGDAPSRVLGIVPNKVRPSTLNHRRNLDKLNEAFPGLVWKPIVQRTVWTEATNYSQLLFAYAPHGDAAGDAWALVDQLTHALQTAVPVEKA